MIVFSCRIISFDGPAVFYVCLAFFYVCLAVFYVCLVIF